MADGSAQSEDGQTASKAAVPGHKAPSEAKLKLETRIKSLEKERDRLKAQLEVAGERITSLEQGRDDVVNRIDWVIDSLHNAIESEA
ncbi:MAG: DUF4164 family protein [Hyphomicrobium sp.]